MSDKQVDDERTSSTHHWNTTLWVTMRKASIKLMTQVNISMLPPADLDIADILVDHRPQGACVHIGVDVVRGRHCALRIEDSIAVVLRI